MNYSITIKIALILILTLVLMSIVKPVNAVTNTEDYSMEGTVVFKDDDITITRHENKEAVCYIYRGISEQSHKMECKFK